MIGPGHLDPHALPHGKPAPADPRPRALLLSHCVPDPLGPADRARAWQLLREIGRSHAVCLACVADGPFDWAQWRTVEAQTHRLAIAPATPWHWSPAPDLHLLLSPISIYAALDPVLSAWLRQVSFDLVVCTHLSLWPRAAATAAPRHACDLAPRPSLMHQRLADRAAAPERYWRRLLARTCAARERALAETCDLAILGDTATDFQPEHTAVLPAATDAAYFARLAGVELPPGADDAPCLVLHADWRFAAARRDLRAFLTRAWPRIRQAVPGATWELGTRDGALLRSPHLRRPAAIACPTVEPLIGRWPIQQAQALGAAVVAHRDAAAGLSAPVTSSVLRLADGPDFADLCIEALRAPRRAAAVRPLRPVGLTPHVVPVPALFVTPAAHLLSSAQPALARAA
jgi:hypothetical protein